MSRFRKVIVISLAAVALLSIWVVQVAAVDSFSDVADATFYHDDVNWLVDRGVTAGCGSGKYCPNSAVTRGSMATFLKNLGDAIAPEFIQQSGSVGAVDLDVNYIACATGSTEEYIPPFEQVAELNGNVSIVSSATVPDVDFFAYAQYSINDGATWICFDNCWSSEAQASVASQDIELAVSDVLHLTPGEDYRFAFELSDSENSTGDATADTASGGWCNFTVRIDNDFVG